MLLVLTLLLLGRSTEARPQRVPDAAAERHIRQVIQSLPPDSSLRRSLEELYVTQDAQKHLDEMKRSTSSAILRRAMEEGVLPDGIHKPWMDDMKRAGVKLAMFEVHGFWHTNTRFQPQSTKRIIYRKNYDGPGSQITDDRELAQIKESGLETKLQEAAFQKSKKAIWIGIDSPPKEGDACITDIYLFDDEWLVDNAFSTNLPRVGRYNPEEFALGYAADVGDLLTVRQQLSTQQFSPQQLDIALFGAVGYPSDNTDVISLLLKAGANVNTERQGGSTPLMHAVPTFNLSNMKLLLSSGADVNRKTTTGSTAYSLALQQIKQFEQNGSRPPEYMPEMLRLLKPPASAKTRAFPLRFVPPRLAQKPFTRPNSELPPSSAHGIIRHSNRLPA